MDKRHTFIRAVIQGQLRMLSVERVGVITSTDTTFNHRFQIFWIFVRWIGHFDNAVFVLSVSEFVFFDFIRQNVSPCFRPLFLLLLLLCRWWCGGGGRGWTWNIRQCVFSWWEWVLIGRSDRSRTCSCRCC